MIRTREQIRQAVRPPAPVTMEMYPYTLTLTRQGDWVRIDTRAYSIPMSGALVHRSRVAEFCDHIRRLASDSPRDR